MAERLPLDQARLRPHLRSGAQRPAARQTQEPAEGQDLGPLPTGDDWLRRRGVPILGPGVDGAVSGSNPLAAVLQARTRRARRRL